MIILLQSYPQDMIVVDDICEILPEDFHILEDYPLGDGANPNCIYLDKVLKID